MRQEPSGRDQWIQVLDKKFAHVKVEHTKRQSKEGKWS